MPWHGYVLAFVLDMVCAVAIGSYSYTHHWRKRQVAGVCVLSGAVIAMTVLTLYHVPLSRW